MNINDKELYQQTTPKNTMFYIRLPLIVALTLMAGIFIGAKMFGSRTDQDVNNAVLKFREVFKYIDSYYVDSVQMDKIAETGIKKMLEELDPHTSYIPSSEVEAMNAPLEGDFEGIGVEFTIFKDTLEVVATIQGGPSEEVGMQSGDKIIAVNGKNIAGIKLTNKTIFENLRGKKGTKVELTVIRNHNPTPLYFTVTRNKIPTYTVDGSYMIDKQTGYIKITRFGAKTYEEFRKSMEQLISQGMKRLILDLRGNPGGYMDKAVRIADEFLANNKLIVYTKGKENRFDSKEKAAFEGVFEQGAVIVLLDEGSASASEIVAGALQDNDRALIVGRRSFGKGLVQKPIILTDGSELRLTISRYYTPSGRSIQKKYELGHAADYSADIAKRYEQGELYNADSIKFDKEQAFKTAAGRTVYGGGGISPDHFIAQDTSYITTYLNQLYRANLIREFALTYANKNKITLKQMSEMNYVTSFELSDLEMQTFIAFAQNEGVKFVAKDYEISKKFIKNQIKAFIARTIWQKENVFSRILGLEDYDLIEATKLFDEAEKLLKQQK
jgi:carboxyl-terminal processing protease